MSPQVILRQRDTSQISNVVKVQLAPFDINLCQLSFLFFMFLLHRQCTELGGYIYMYKESIPFILPSGINFLSAQLDLPKTDIPPTEEIPQQSSQLFT